MSKGSMPHNEPVGDEKGHDTQDPFGNFAPGDEKQPPTGGAEVGTVGILILYEALRAEGTSKAMSHIDPHAAESLFQGNLRPIRIIAYLQRPCRLTASTRTAKSNNQQDPRPHRLRPPAPVVPPATWSRAHGKGPHA